MDLARDPGLPHRDAALDPGSAAAALASHLAGLEGCRPRYVRYRPGRRLVVLYDLALDGTRTLAHVTMLPPRRVERLWGRIDVAGLADQARLVPELGAVLQLFPADVRLPGLAGAIARGPAELVRYKPGRRAVLRYDGVYGKLRADEAGARHVELSRRLIECGIPTPAPLGYLPELRMTLHEAHRGTRLAELREADLEAWMEPVAAALARLHATTVADLPPHSIEGEIEDLRAAAETAAAIVPHRRAKIDSLLGHLVARLAALRREERTIHGSFHYDQVLVGDDGVALLDLDSAAVGEPLLDVGHFASYLSAAGEMSARERFLDAWAAPPSVSLYEAAALLRWSSLPFRDLEPDWPAAVERRIDLALERSGAWPAPIIGA
jgi:aminoglycoside phosphotransferase (APT) family kinase protein